MRVEWVLAGLLWCAPVWAEELVDRADPDLELLEFIGEWDGMEKAEAALERDDAALAELPQIEGDEDE